MRKMSRRVGTVVLALVAMGVGLGGPVHAAAPQGKQAAAGPQGKDSGLKEAVRLATDVERLTEEAKYNEALPLAERVLAIREKALGPNHPDVAAALHALGELYRRKADFAHAEPIFQRALASREKALGPEHPAVAQSLDDLATLLLDYRRAELPLQRALTIKEKVLGLLVRTVGRWKREAGRILKVQILPPELSKRVGARRGVVCEYHFLDLWRSASPSTINDRESWFSIAAPQWMPVTLDRGS